MKLPSHIKDMIAGGHLDHNTFKNFEGALKGISKHDPEFVETEEDDDTFCLFIRLNGPLEGLRIKGDHLAMENIKAWDHDDTTECLDVFLKKGTPLVSVIRTLETLEAEIDSALLTKADELAKDAEAIKALVKGDA